LSKKKKKTSLDKYNDYGYCWNKRNVSFTLVKWLHIQLGCEKKEGGKNKINEEFIESEFYLDWHFIFF